MKKLLVAMLLLYPLSASAATYEWTDEHGTVSFTEDLGNVPKKYRKKVKVLEGDDSGAPQTIDIPEPVKGKGAKVEAPAAIPAGKKLFGGKDEAAWRNEFQNAAAEVRQTESDLTDLRARLADTSKMSRSEYLMIHNTVKADEIRLQQQKKRLEQLKETANRLGVTSDYRQ